MLAKDKQSFVPTDQITKLLPKHHSSEIKINCEEKKSSFMINFKKKLLDSMSQDAAGLH